MGVRPVMDFTPSSARHLAAGFRFGSEKAERELGLQYTPVREAVAQDLATFRPSAR